MSKAIVLICAFVFLGATVGNIVYPRHGLQKHGGPIEDLINATLESLKADLTDPVVLPDLNIPLTTNVTAGWLNVTNATLQGLNKFQATYIQLHDITGLNVTLVIPELVLNLEYVVDLLVAEIVPIYGAGPVSITIDGASLNITTTADVTLDPPDITGVNGTRSILNIETAVFGLSGLFNDLEFDELINTLLNDTFVTLVNTHTGAIADIFSPLIEALINQLISG